ncbi:hypothetical protein FOZ63_028028, partial [Perkinsus olseni]
MLFSSLPGLSLLIVCCDLIEFTSAIGRSQQTVLEASDKPQIPPLQAGGIGFKQAEFFSAASSCWIETQHLRAAFLHSNGPTVASLQYRDPQAGIKRRVIDTSDAAEYRKKGDESCEDFLDRIHGKWYQESSESYAKEVDEMARTGGSVNRQFELVRYVFVGCLASHRSAEIHFAEARLTRGGSPRSRGNFKLERDRVKRESPPLLENPDRDRTQRWCSIEGKVRHEPRKAYFRPNEDDGTIINMYAGRLLLLQKVRMLPQRDFPHPHYDDCYT